MHPEAYSFVQSVVAGQNWRGRWILELGSYNVNGSVRPLFPGALYIGADRRAGPGVDLVSDIAEVDGRGVFDVVVSTEAMEHMSDPPALITTARHALRPGGLLVITAAAPERAPHGNDGGGVAHGEHYGGITPAQLRRWLRDWQDIRIEHDQARGDVYATARSPEEAA